MCWPRIPAKGRVHVRSRDPKVAFSSVGFFGDEPQVLMTFYIMAVAFFHFSRVQFSNLFSHGGLLWALGLCARDSYGLLPSTLGAPLRAHSQALSLFTLGSLSGSLLRTTVPLLYHRTSELDPKITCQNQRTGKGISPFPPIPGAYLTGICPACLQAPVCYISNPHPLSLIPAPPPPPSTCLNVVLKKHK